MRLLFAVLACLNLQLTPGHVRRILDGDTFAVYSLGIPPEEKIRILHVDTPELRSGPLADSAKAFTTRWLQAGDFTITACSRDSFGRLLAVVTRNGRSLADTLIASGLGVPYR